MMGIVVVCDDLLPGGTKRRALHVLHVLLNDHDEYVYASPVQGAAPVLTRSTERRCDDRRSVEASMGFLSNVSAKAVTYCKTTGAQLLPFGLDHPDVINALADVARSLDITPAEVWSITSSGVLSRALQQAWPDAAFYGVRVGPEPNAGHATVFNAPEKFDQKSRVPPPFNSNIYYDAKAWRFVKEHASPGALFWNVA